LYRVVSSVLESEVEEVEQVEGWVLVVLPESEGVEVLSVLPVSWVCRVGVLVELVVELLPLRTACVLLLRGTPLRKNHSFQCLQTFNLVTVLTLCGLSVLF
jgi:hypothetical protein